VIQKEENQSSKAPTCRWVASLSVCDNLLFLEYFFSARKILKISDG
jgi:hypothetical protein